MLYSVSLSETIPQVPARLTDTSRSEMGANEIANVSRRKMGMSWVEARNFLLMVRGLLKVEPITIEIHDAGIDLAERYGLSVYDAMIASAALVAQCNTLFSEDLQDGLLISGQLRVINPF